MLSSGSNLVVFCIIVLGSNLYACVSFNIDTLIY